MIWHYHIRWDINMRKMIMDIPHTFVGNRSHFRQMHFPARNFTEIMFAVAGADGHKIFTAIVIVPLGTRRWYAVSVMKSVFGHHLFHFYGNNAFGWSLLYMKRQ